MATVTIGGQEVTLALPKSYAIRYEVFLASAGNQLRAWACALGLCWQGPTRPKARYEQTFSPLAYGGMVLDELVARGIPASEIAAAGVVAHNLLSSEFLPTEPEVKAVEGFTGPPEPSTT